MNISSAFHALWAKLAAGLPMAVEVAEFMGAKLPPGPAAGQTKLAGVVASMKPILMSVEGSTPGAAPDGEVMNSAVTDLVNATVKLRNVWAKPPAPAAVAPLLEHESSVAAAKSEAAVIASPGAPDIPAAQPPAAPALPAETEPAPAPYTLPPGAVEVKPGVIDLNGVRLVWDYQSKGWTTPS